MSELHNHPLNNGATIPTLGLGVYQIRNGGPAAQAVRWALDAGYRHIDTASLYGNEEDVGKAIRESGVPREDIFVTTKLWPTNYLWAERAFHASLKRLGLEYVDLYLLHWPSPIGKDRAWRTLEKLYEQGLCKAIGVSNYSVKQLKALAEIAKITPAVNQVEFSPFLYRKELLEYCNAKGIVVEAYSPLTRGKRLNDATIDVIAQKYGKTPAQIMLRWAVQHGLVVLPKSKSHHRIIENSLIFDFTLGDEDMRTMDSLHENFHALLP